MTPYTFRAKLHHVWDGDTIWLTIDRGEGWQSVGKYRLWGVNTPEIRGSGVTALEKVYAGEAKAFVDEMLRDKTLIISTHKGDGKFDWMVEIWVDGYADQTSLTQCIIDAGHGVEYLGGTKKTWAKRKEIQDQQRAVYEAANAYERSEDDEA